MEDKNQAVADSRTENKGSSNPEQAINSLREYRSQTAQSSSQLGQTEDKREKFIPRERFDEVLAKAKENEAKVQQLQQVLMQLQLKAGQQSQTVSPTGMAQPVQQPQLQPQPQQPSFPQLPDFNNPEVKREWQSKLANNPIPTIQELVRLMLVAEGAPALHQLQQTILQQLTPLHRAYMSQVASSYASMRANDPSFAQIKPVFEDTLYQAMSKNPNLQLNDQTLGLIEHIARARAVQLGIDVQTPLPYSERPGSNASLGQGQPSVKLSSMEEEVAKRFGMTPEEYHQSKMRLGYG